MKKIFTLFSLCAMISGSALAQTGLTNESISFSTAQYPGQTRQVWYNVPTSYSTSKKYKLFICLHGQGSTPSSYLQTLAQVYFGLASTFGDVIMMSPTEGQAQSGFSNPTGEDDGIIDVAIARARIRYPNIDTTKIYMTGFSMGARSGLQIGLSKPTKYRGMMLYTPAVQGLNEAKNLTSFKYTYTNGKYVPICMTVGAADPNGYPAYDAEVQNQLQLAGAQSMLKSIPGLAHNIPQTAQDYVDCYNWCEQHLYVPVTGVNDQDAINAAGITMFPNPANGEFWVSLNVMLEADDNVITTVYNLAGQKVYEQANNYINQVHRVNMENQPSGMYMVVVTAPFGRFSKTVYVN